MPVAVCCRPHPIEFMSSLKVTLHRLRRAPVSRSVRVFSCGSLQPTFSFMAGTCPPVDCTDVRGPKKTTVANRLLLRHTVRPYPSASVLFPQVMTFRGPLSSSLKQSCVRLCLAFPKHAICRQCCLRGSPVTPDRTPRDLRMSPLHRPKRCLLFMTRFAVQMVLF